MISCTNVSRSTTLFMEIKSPAAGGPVKSEKRPASECSGRTKLRLCYPISFLQIGLSPDRPVAITGGLKSTRCNYGLRTGFLRARTTYLITPEFQLYRF